VRLLLDTHVFLWLESQPQKLERHMRTFLDPTNMLYLSAASVWEIANKRAVGKLTFTGSICEAAERRSLLGVPVTSEHAEFAASLPKHHSDPFDRMLVAQGILEKLTLVTHDEQIMRYPVALLRL